jgi:hypothetical protein
VTERLEESLQVFIRERLRKIAHIDLHTFAFSYYSRVTPAIIRVARLLTRAFRFGNQRLGKLIRMMNECWQTLRTDMGLLSRKLQNHKRNV